MRAETALEVVLRRTSPESHSHVLDIGAGGGEHTKVFAERGYRVTAVDLGVSRYYTEGLLPRLDEIQEPWTERVKLEVCDIEVPFDRHLDYAGYGIVWASHVLEHMVDVGDFLGTARVLCIPDGLLAITVPLRKDAVVGGHLSLWTPGLLVYRLILAGIDCRYATVLRIGEEISVIAANHAVPTYALRELHHDAGDVDRLARYFPEDWDVHEGSDGVEVPTVGW